MPKFAAAYIRRSHASVHSPGESSKAVQQEATKRLAAQHCEANVPLTEYVDWGLSGRKDDRPQYLKLKADIAADSVSCVVAYSLSRLGRTARELDSFLTLCEQHGVTVATDRDGVLTASSATSRFMRRLLAELAELESELVRERVYDALERRKARGDAFGNVPLGMTASRGTNGERVFEPTDEAQIVVDAYREAGSAMGAARLLNERGELTPREVRRKAKAGVAGETFRPTPGLLWAPSVVTKIVTRTAPELLPDRRPGGQRRPTRAMLGQLIQCHCGGTMTAVENVTHRQLYCSRAKVTSRSHGQSHISYRKLLPALKAEAAKYMPDAVVTTVGHSEQEREVLVARRARISELYEMGGLTKEQTADRLSQVDKELERTRSADRAVESLRLLPDGIDWDDEPAVIGDTLRRLWSRVVLDEGMNVVRFDWRLPPAYYDPAARDALTKQADKEVGLAQQAGS